MTSSYTLPRKADQAAICQLARWLVNDQVITVGCVPDNLVRMVFMPVAFGAFRGWSADDLAEIVVFAVHDVDDTTPLGINGFPMFSQCRIWLKEDFVAAAMLATQVKAAMDELLGPESDKPLRDLKVGLTVPD